MGVSRRNRFVGGHGEAQGSVLGPEAEVWGLGGIVVLLCHRLGPGHRGNAARHELAELEAVALNVYLNHRSPTP